MKSYILDACALIAYLSDEKGADKIEILLFSNNNIILHKINLYEVYYGIMRDDGQQKADQILKQILDLPITIISNFSDNTLKESAKIKVKYKISLADSIILGEAKNNNYIVVSADHHEFDIIHKDKSINFYWIR